MARPKKASYRTRTLAGGVVAYYASFTDQWGVRHKDQLLGKSPDWNPERAQREVNNIQYRIDHGTWRPASAHAPRDPDPLFIDYASDWFADRCGEELAQNTKDHLEWSLVSHLIPFFGDDRLSLITKARVDEYRTEKVKQGRLSARSINRTIAVLSRILEQAVDHDVPGVTFNAAAGRARRAPVKTRPKVGVWLEYDPLMALLNAADELDRTRRRRHDRGLGRKALLAVMFLAGLRVSEACQLQRLHISWVRNTIRVHDDAGSVKTEAGFRDIPMGQLLHDILRHWWDRHPDPRPRAPLFPSGAGTPRERNNVRNRVLAPAIALADERLAAAGENPLPTKLKDGKVVSAISTHAGRRTAINWWAEYGYDERSVMAWVGHADAKLTLEVYRGARERVHKDPRIIAAVEHVPTGEPKLRAVSAA